MNKERKFNKGTFHHLYNRGVNKGTIFYNRDCYLYFLKRLNLYKNKYQIQILSYCLMPNHFHLFVKQISQENSISEFISSLLNSYVKSINKKYKRSGTLFESKTKNKIISDEHYFIWIIKYIIDNPVKSKLVNNCWEWEFSNAKELKEIRNGKLTAVNEVNSYFQSKDQMKRFLTDKEIKVNYEF